MRTAHLVVLATLTACTGESPVQTISSPFIVTAIQTTPADGATDVPLDTAPSVLFGYRMQLREGSNARLISLYVDGSPVSGDVVDVLDDDRMHTWLFEPDDDLLPGTEYQVVVSADAETGGISPWGEIEDELSWTFTTEEDTRLQLVSTSPANGTTDVGIDDPMTLTFNANIDPSTVTDNSITLLADIPVAYTSNNTVTGLVTVQGNTLSFTPSEGEWQEYETTYTLQLDSGVAGVNGEPLGSVGPVAFTTAFFAPDHSYLFHTWADDRTKSMQVTLTSPYQAYFSRDTGGHPASRWYAEPVLDGWFLKTEHTGVNAVLAARTNGAPADVEPQTPGEVWENTIWHADYYGDHPSWVQQPGDSPFLYYLTTPQFTDVLTVSYDSERVLDKAALAPATGSIDQLFWFNRL